MVRSTVAYEWDLETVDKHGDIQDHWHADKVSDLMNEPEPDDGEHYDLVLIREIGNEEDGVISRSWAYVEAGQLPEEFDSGHKVPSRFQRELTKAKEGAK